MCFDLSMRLVFALFLAGCGGPGKVEFVDGHCVVNGSAATLQQVEQSQARISERIVARQPVMVVVTILVVLLAGASHIEKLVLLFSTRRSQAHGLGERIRLALDRYRDHPIRYFSIVAGTLVLLGVAGGAYVFLDAEKRANERALGLLQFCHVAMRSQQADAMLDEQRRNLADLESTAGSIRGLVDRLPPQHQEEARQIVEQLRRSLGDQGKLVNAWVEKSSETSRQLEAHNALLEQGLSALQSNFKGVLQDLAEQLKRHDQRIGTAEDGEKSRLEALQAALDKLAARPQCPACICEASRPDASAIR
jgi:hypothetical protein